MSNPAQSRPDTFDPAPNADELARLANGPLSLAQLTPDTSPHSFASESAIATRFDWPRLQTRPSRWLLVLLLVAGLCAWQAWAEFDYSWVLSGPLLLWALPALILFYAVFWRVGEWLPLLGRSYVQVRGDGLKVRLFYGRAPVARRFLGNWLTGLSLLWPQCRRLPWREIEQVAIYHAYYIMRWDNLYWVRLWSRDRFGYTVLVTPYRQQAEELATLIVRRAKLREWAEISERGANILDPALGQLNSDDHFRQRMDKRRISLRGANISVVTHLWRSPIISRPIPKPTFAAALKLTLAAALLLIALNYNYLLSLLIWPPADATGDIGQSPVPPLHEVWSVGVDRSFFDSLLFGGGKVTFITGNVATSYDASTGTTTAKYNLPYIVLSCSSKHSAISEDGNRLYYTAYEVADNDSMSLGYNNSCSRTFFDVVAFDLRTNQIISRQQVTSDVVFASDFENKVGAVWPQKPKTGSGELSWAEHQSGVDFVRLIATDYRTGRLVWRSPAVGNTMDHDLGAKSVVGASMVYLLYGDQLHAYVSAR